MCPRPRSHRGRASFANGQNFREVGLHQCPSERKGEGVPVRSLHVPSHVSSHPQTAAKCGAFRLQPRGSRVRQTACWSKPDSNSRSHLRRYRCEAQNRTILGGDHEGDGKIQDRAPCGAAMADRGSAPCDGRGIPTSPRSLIPPANSPMPESERSSAPRSSTPIARRCGRCR